MNVALETMRERDRRVYWERMRANLLQWAERLLALAVAGGIGAAIAIPYAYDAGKAAEAKREVERPKETVKDCRARLDGLLDRLTPKRKGT